MKNTFIKNLGDIGTQILEFENRVKREHNSEDDKKNKKRENLIRSLRNYIKSNIKKEYNNIDNQNSYKTPYTYTPDQEQQIEGEYINRLITEKLLSNWMLVYNRVTRHKKTAPLKGIIHRTPRTSDKIQTEDETFSDDNYGLFTYFSNDYSKNSKNINYIKIENERERYYIDKNNIPRYKSHTVYRYELNKHNSEEETQHTFVPVQNKHALLNLFVIRKLAKNSYRMLDMIEFDNKDLTSNQVERLKNKFNNIGIEIIDTSKS